MSRLRLPSEDHVARLCREASISNGRVRGAAFALKVKDEGELSVNWVQCQHVDPSERTIEAAIVRLRAVTRSSQFVAILNVSEVREVEYRGKNLDVIDTSHPKNLCHCSIIGMDMGPECFLAQKELADLANNNPIHRLEVEA